MKVWELLDSPDKLIKDALAIDKNNKSVIPWEPEACKWCVTGAILFCYDFYMEKIDILKNNINEEIDMWAKSHSYEEIIKKLRELDI